MNRTAFVLAGVAACCSAPAMAQEVHTEAQAGDYVASDVVEVEEVTVLPARRVIPMRRQPVVIERIVIDGDPAKAGADWVSRTPVIHAYRAAPAQSGYSYGYSQTGGMETLPLPPGARVVQFDRSAWLAECRDRLSTYEDDQRGAIIGALAGAALGGVLGNRIAGRGNRTLGTVAGAVAGGVAGAAIGDAVEGDPQPDAGAYQECEAYLDDYMASAAAGELSGAPAYYGQEYMLVPVTITVPQKAVYREIEVEVETEE